MKKLTFLLRVILMSVLFTGCLNNEPGDKIKAVEMKIYPETGYGSSIMSNIWSEPLLFSDSDNPEKRALVDIIIEGFDFEYERGYEYIFKAQKIWMHEPPQDVSSIKYVFVELVSKTKTITEDSEKKLKLYVSPKTVIFTPRFPYEYEQIEGHQVFKKYNALHVKEEGSINWMALTKIEGFDFENGYEYLIDVKKITYANPYSVKYILVDVLSKQKINQ